MLFAIYRGKTVTLTQPVTHCSDGFVYQGFADAVQIRENVIYETFSFLYGKTRLRKKVKRLFLCVLTQTPMKYRKFFSFLYELHFLKNLAVSNGSQC